MTSRFPELSVILPVYNEAAVIRRTLEQVESFCRAHCARYQIIVVDDGSTDDTHKELLEISGENNHLLVLHHVENAGYGHALVSGFRHATCAWVFFMDADGQFDISGLERVLANVSPRSLWLGYRCRRADSTLRMLLGRGYSGLVNAAFGWSFQDINCGFKLFPLDLAQRISQGTRTGVVNIDIIHTALSFGYTIHEMPTAHLQRQSGKATGASLSILALSLWEGMALYRRVSRVSSHSRLPKTR